MLLRLLLLLRVGSMLLHAICSNGLCTWWSSCSNMLLLRLLQLLLLQLLLLR